jgi:hypothetical protein
VVEALILAYRAHMTRLDLSTATIARCLAPPPAKSM